MPWLSDGQLNILNKVFVDYDHMFLNRFNNLRQRFLGFYFTEAKSLTLLCKNLDKFNHGIDIQNQYKNTLRNIGLLNPDKKTISAYGNKLLKVLYYNNNRLINLMRSENGTFTIETMDLKDAYQLELFIYLVVLHTGKVAIGYDGNPIDIVHNIENFFSQIQDTLNATRKNDYQTLVEQIKAYINIQDLDKLFLLQIMNYCGYELFRFLNLTTAEKAQFWANFAKAVSECPSEANGLSESEKFYFDIIHPYTSNQIQRDIRHRVKYALSCYIINMSITYRQKKIKLRKKDNCEALYNILSFEQVSRIFEQYQLKDIFNFIEQDRESIYFEEIVKYYRLENAEQYNDADLTISESLASMQAKGINKGDKIILIDNHGHCLADFTFIIKNIISNNNTILLERVNPVNKSIIERILEEVE